MHTLLLKKCDCVNLDNSSSKSVMFLLFVNLYAKIFMQRCVFVYLLSFLVFTYPLFG